MHSQRMNAYDCDAQHPVRVLFCSLDVRNHGSKHKAYRETARGEQLLAEWDADGNYSDHDEEHIHNGFSAFNRATGPR